MNDIETLRKLQSTWPETDSYLVKLGQLQNDLMVLRELQMADEYSPTWLDQLGIEAEDLITVPSAMEALRFLDSRGIIVRSTSLVPAFQELSVEQMQMFEQGEESTPNLLEIPGVELLELDNQKLWALPELQQSILSWAAAAAHRVQSDIAAPTLAQACIFMMLLSFLEQESEMTPGWAAECTRSLLSSDFYIQAANQPQQTATN